MDRNNNPIKKFLNRLGPGLITGASDDDPSGIGTYTQAGAALGFATLWTAIVTLPWTLETSIVASAATLTRLLICCCATAGAEAAASTAAASQAFRVFMLRFSS
jgi:hypothetical protein